VSGNGDNFENDSLTAHVSDNVGIRTVNSAQRQINAGETTAVVTHGLVHTPLIHDIHITPANNPTNDVGHCWVSGATATTFTINCENDPGASAALFNWTARTLK
jgi:hypothetical protein